MFDECMICRSTACSLLTQHLRANINLLTICCSSVNSNQLRAIHSNFFNWIGIQMDGSNQMRCVRIKWRTEQTVHRVARSIRVCPSSIEFSQWRTFPTENKRQNDKQNFLFFFIRKLFVPLHSSIISWADFKHRVSVFDEPMMRNFQMIFELW